MLAAPAIVTTPGLLMPVNKIVEPTIEDYEVVADHSPNVVRYLYRKLTFNGEYHEWVEYKSPIVL